MNKFWKLLVLFLVTYFFESCRLSSFDKNCTVINFRKEIKSNQSSISFLNQLDKRFEVLPTIFADSSGNCLGLYFIEFKTKDKKWKVRVPLLTNGEKYLLNTSKYNGLFEASYPLNKKLFNEILSAFPYEDKKLDSLISLFNEGANLFPVDRIRLE